MSAATIAVLDFQAESLARNPDVPQILCIDGRAGTGKSTVAAELSVEEGGALVIHTDDLLPGWGGLPQVPALLAALVEPLAQGRSGSYPRYDWIAGEVTETVVVPPHPFIVIEGVGAGSRALRPWRTMLAWLETPTETRRTRALTRDGETFAPYWDAWAEAELEYLRTDADRDAADLVLRT